MYAHVLWVVLKTHAYARVIASSSARSLNGLARSCGLATRFTAETHPSLPNYLAMTSGSAHSVGDDAGPASHPVAGTSIFGQVNGSWRSEEESMPSPCLDKDSGRYAVRHNPAVYYTD